MNVFVSSANALVVKPVTRTRRRRAQAGGFALVVTLLIVSLLAVVAVSYLTSMLNERVTADAYTSQTRAEQAAQAGVEAAEAILAQSFRDFPDSATVWDPYQTVNANSPKGGEAATTVNTPYNAGTSLYIRATPQTQQGVTVANPSPTPGPNSLLDSTGKLAPNSPDGNNPSNLACQTFVLPLISGVPGGYAQLVSQAAYTGGMPPSGTPLLPKFDLTETDPAKQTDPKAQYCTDLNVRRFAGDLKGAIGSPADWVTSQTTTPLGPKPARALWVNLQGSDKRVVGRYAFWMEDESFRANASYLGAGANPPDNNTRPMVKDSNGNSVPRILQPGDYTLVGLLSGTGDSTITSNASGYATDILGTRAGYPGGFLADPLAFMHGIVDGKPTNFSLAAQDALRYLTTNQSGTLNLTRHGTQRYNLNTLTTGQSSAPPMTGVIQNQIDTLINTLKFHLPYFGQRFYRMLPTGQTAPSPALLNTIAGQVPGSPAVAGAVNSQANIYYYKVAANLLDYLDPDSQPTIIDNTGHIAVRPTTANPLLPLNDGAAGTGTTDIWAQGKEAAPFIQEAAVRYRPVVFAHQRSHPPLQFDLKVDYYVEFWNMTDRDVYVHPQGNALPNLGDATLHIRDQQIWTSYSENGVGPGSLTVNGSSAPSLSAPPDEEIDLTNDVYQQTNGSSQLVSTGVVFKAGTCTVITTDPDFATYVFKGPPGAVSTPAAGIGSLNLATTYYCKHLIAGQRDYSGVVNAPADGMQNVFVENGKKEYDDIEIFFGNSNGIIDSALSAISVHGSSQYTNTDKYYSPTDPAAYPGSYNDYSYSSCLMGNFADGNLFFGTTPSEMGDPRTNNEQLGISSSYNSSLGGDQSRYIYGSAADTTLGYPNFLSQRPDQGYQWGDYYTLPTPLGTNPDATNAPMVVADNALSSIGQLGDVFDPARLPGTGGITYSRGGGRTYKIGQRDDRYSNDPSTNAAPNNTADSVPASNGWASWRLTDVFDAASPTADFIELPARVNINGVQRDKGAALLALLQGFVFQPMTSSSPSSVSLDPIVHGDGHNGSTSLQMQPIDTTSSTNGYAQIVKQMSDRLNNSSPSSGASGPFFERGELGELGTSSNAIFGVNPANSFSASNKALVSSVDMNKTFDHGREELVRRIEQMICTRGDTFTVYTVGQSILQSTVNAAMKVTGTHRMRLTFRLVPKRVDGSSFNPSYISNSNVVTTQNTSYQPSPTISDLLDPKGNSRFSKPDHYAIQVLQTSTY